MTAPHPVLPLLIAGHGTADTEGADEFRRFAERVGKKHAAAVAGGFIELSPPPLGDAVTALVAAGHAKGDIPAALAREKLRNPGLTIAYGRPLGAHPTILALLRERLSALAPDAGTTVLLVGRGSSDPDANAEVARAARLLAETTDVAAVEYAFISLATPGVPAGMDRCRALGAQRIIVVPYFLFTGVLPRRVVEQTAAWSAEHGMDVRTAEVVGDGDALADLVLERYAEAVGGDVRANCDTCLYRIALPGHEDKVGAPQTPHHHPDEDGHHHHHHPHPHPAH